MVTPSDKARAARYLEDEYQVSERKSCKVLVLNRNTKRQIQHRPADSSADSVVSLSGNQPRWGYRKVYDRLKLDGERIGRERVRLIRKREGRIKKRRGQTQEVHVNHQSFC